jgi:hypothetical protein
MARLLLDEQLPGLLTAELTGHEARTVRQEGWIGLRNGTLLRTAAASFDVFITMDKSIPFQQVVADIDIAVLLVRARSNTLRALAELIPDILNAIPACVPGTVVTVGDPENWRARRR